jgi:hypothetical protein
VTRRLRVLEPQALPQHRGWEGLMPWHRVNEDGRTFYCSRCLKSTQINEKARAMRDAVARWAVEHFHVGQPSAADLDEDGRKR